MLMGAPTPTCTSAWTAELVANAKAPVADASFTVEPQAGAAIHNIRASSFAAVASARPSLGVRLASQSFEVPAFQQHEHWRKRVTVVTALGLSRRRRHKRRTSPSTVSVGGHHFVILGVKRLTVAQTRHRCQRLRSCLWHAYLGGAASVERC